MLAQLAKVVLGIIIITIIISIIWWPIEKLFRITKYLFSPLINRFGSPMLWIRKKLGIPPKKIDKDDSDDEQQSTNNFIVMDRNKQVTVVDLNVTIVSETKESIIKVPVLVHIITTPKTSLELEFVGATIEELVSVMLIRPIKYCLEQIQSSNSNSNEKVELVSIESKLSNIRDYEVASNIFKVNYGMAISQVIVNMGKKKEQTISMFSDI